MVNPQPILSATYLKLPSILSRRYYMYERGIHLRAFSFCCIYFFLFYFFISSSLVFPRLPSIAIYSLSAVAFFLFFFSTIGTSHSLTLSIWRRRRARRRRKEEAGREAVGKLVSEHWLERSGKDEGGFKNWLGGVWGCEGGKRANARRVRKRHGEGGREGFMKIVLRGRETGANASCSIPVSCKSEIVAFVLIVVSQCDARSIQPMPVLHIKLHTIGFAALLLSFKVMN